MNILFFTIVSIETIEEQDIYVDLLKEFVLNGHNVYIISPIEKRERKNTHIINQNKISILRVEIGNITKTNLIEKALTTITLGKKYINAIRKYYNDINFDLLLYSTPPITFEKVIKYAKKRYNVKCYLLLKDIFPQNAVDLGMFTKLNPIYWSFRKKEINLYRVSDYIGCMSEANKDYLLKNNKFLQDKIVEVCPNSITPRPLSVKSDIDIAKLRNHYNIPNDKVIFIYGGNLGKPQGVEFIIDCINANKENNNIFFLIVGSGTEYEKVNKFIEKAQLNNIKLIPQLPKDEYEILVTICDVGLIFLDNKFTIPNFPSRLLSYMQSSIPVLAATDTSTDIGMTIERGNFGYWCESNDINKFNDLINILLDKNLRKILGSNGRKYLEDNYTSKHSYEIIIKHFK